MTDVTDLPHAVSFFGSLGLLDIGINSACFFLLNCSLLNKGKARETQIYFNAIGSLLLAFRNCKDSSRARVSKNT